MLDHLGKIVIALAIGITVFCTLHAFALSVPVVAGMFYGHKNMNSHRSHIGFRTGWIRWR